MAIKKIEMRPEGTNDYADVIYPMTSIDIIDGLGHYAVASGTNTYTASIPMIKSLYAGVKATVKFTNANSRASTININGLGAKSIIKPGGGNPNIKANGVYGLVYDGTSFQLQGEGGEYGNALAGDVLQGRTIGTENGIVTGTMQNRTNTDTGGSYPLAVKSSYVAGTVHLMPPAGYYNGNVWVKMPEPDLQPANFLAGKKIGNGTGSVVTGTMPNRGAVTSTLTTQGGSYTIPAGYHNGSGKITASFANLSAANIKSGVNIGGVVGTLVPIGSVKVVSAQFRSGYSSSTTTIPSEETIIQYILVGWSGSSNGGYPDVSIQYAQSGTLTYAKSGYITYKVYRDGNKIITSMTGSNGQANYSSAMVYVFSM